jgi:galactokinase
MFTFADRVSLPDAKAALRALNANAALFDPKKPIVAARAPGRLDVMGGIADYSGSLVLELPLSAATFVFVQPARDNRIVVRSLQAGDTGAATVQLDVGDLQPHGEPMSYTDAHVLLTSDPTEAWAAYPLGALLVLLRERSATLKTGLRLLIVSDVPLGKGVSSSAAIEVATMRALAALLKLKLDGRSLALLCQQAENLVVGAPCGVMDQMTSACGERGSLLALRCQPAELEAPMRLPKGLAVWGIDSGVRHAVSGADYGSVRVGAFMGYRIIADVLGMPVKALAPGQVVVDDARFSGYLANITPSLWEEGLREQIPAVMTGADFLSRYHGFTDSVTHIDPARSYAIRQPTAHPIYENHRVSLFRALLGAKPDLNSRQLAGELMYQSHASYSACGLGSAATDALVARVHDAGARDGLYGAKITGGGSGGTVAVLGEATAQAAIQRIAHAHALKHGIGGTILSGSSDGAAKTGFLRVQRVR